MTLFIPFALSPGDESTQTNKMDSSEDEIQCRNRMESVRIHLLGTKKVQPMHSKL